MYCGVGLTQNDLMSEASVFDAAALEDVNTGIAGCILDNKDLMKSFNRQEYTPSFEEYCEKYKPLFISLNECYTAAAPNEREDLKNNAVKAFMDGIAADVSAALKPNDAREQIR